MLWTVAWTILGSLLTLGVGFVATKGGRRHLKRARTKMRQHRRRRGKAAWSAYRVRYRKTRRGSRRVARRQQAPRLTFGHVRSPADPHPARVLGRKAVDRYQLNRQRSQDARSQSPKRTAGQRVRTLFSQGPWSATKAEVRHKVSNARADQCEANRVDGYRCQNRVLIGDEGHALPYCYVHRNERPAGSPEQREANQHRTGRQQAAYDRVQGSRTVQGRAGAVSREGGRS